MKTLPKIDLPLYETTLPSNGKKITYRPFTVKEEKILLTAKESEDISQVNMSIKQILNNCITNININDLAVFDLEYMLMLIRSKSVNNKVDFVIEDPETNEEIKLTLEIENIKLKTYPNHSNMIKLNNDYVLYMKYPNIDTIGSVLNEESDDYYDIVLSCLDKVVSPDEMFNFSEYTKKEIEDFVETLDGTVVEKMELFFTTMPKLYHEIKYTNNLGHEKTFVIEGTKSFFI